MNTKITPYGRTLVVVGLLAIAATVALVWLIGHTEKPDTDPEVNGTINHLQGEIEQLTIERDDYARRSDQFRKRVWALSDSLQNIETTTQETLDRIQNLKRQAHEAAARDYRRYTDADIERLLSDRYTADTLGQ
jgi:uncharacterized protein YoxC